MSVWSEGYWRGFVPWGSSPCSFSGPPLVLSVTAISRHPSPALTAPEWPPAPVPGDSGLLGPPPALSCRSVLLRESPPVLSCVRSWE